jgi:hypothetical protein
MSLGKMTLGETTLGEKTLGKTTLGKKTLGKKKLHLQFIGPLLTYPPPLGLGTPCREQVIADIG